MYFFSEREKFIKTESKSLMARKNDPVGIAYPCRLAILQNPKSPEEFENKFSFFKTRCLS